MQETTTKLKRRGIVIVFGEEGMKRIFRHFCVPSTICHWMTGMSDDDEEEEEEGEAPIVKRLTF